MWSLKSKVSELTVRIKTIRIKTDAKSLEKMKINLC